MTDESIINGARYCRENGITVVSYNMVGLPTSTLQDDINTVDFCIKAKIDVPEFAIFQPLPKTELGEMCKNNKLIDKEDNLNFYGFTGGESPLNSFTEKEKNAQKNISLLAPIVVRHPFLRNIVLNHLIYVKSNIIFRKIYAIDRIITYQKKVFPMNYSLKERWNVFKKALKIEKIKREGD
jgi:radical SAM superfamily enzyme YgiQ (UPF0313 family)